MLAKKFIQDHASSILLASVRMKLGELYYRDEDFANAQTQFELLADQQSKGPLTERALFFAGEAAMASMAAQSLERALVLLDRVVQLNGSFIELLTVAEPDKLGTDGLSQLFGAHNRDFLARQEGLSGLLLESRDAAADVSEHGVQVELGDLGEVLGELGKPANERRECGGVGGLRCAGAL